MNIYSLCIAALWKHIATYAYYMVSKCVWFAVLTFGLNFYRSGDFATTWQVNRFNITGVMYKYKSRPDTICWHWLIGTIAVKSLTVHEWGLPNQWNSLSNDHMFSMNMSCFFIYCGLSCGINVDFHFRNLW